MKTLIYPKWVVLWAVVTSAHAAPVTWTAGPTETIDENAISLNGTLFHAGTWGTGAGIGPLKVPVGTSSITFENMTSSATVGTLSAAATGGEYYDPGVWTPAGTPSVEFQAVMDGTITDGVNPKTAIVNGLVAGKSYQIQLFVSDDRACCAARTMEWSDSATDNAETSHETATFSSGSSSYVIGTFVADGPTQTFYMRGVAQTQNYLNAYILRDLSPDTDGDGIPDHIEDTYAFLSKANPADAAADQDTDGLSNLLEYQKRLNLQAADADGDGLNDGAEVAAGTNPRVADTDGDGVSDALEVNTYGTNPLLVDTDGDIFRDGYEIQAGSDPKVATSTPNGAILTIRGTATASLRGSDLTDPENDGSDATPAGSGFNWVSATASSKPDFQASEGALNIFDNKVGGGEAKWCCDGPTQTATVLFSAFTSLTEFTITSGDDAAERDPRVWEIQGSNDGTNFSTIIRFNYPQAAIFTARNQVINVKLPLASLPYKYIRYSVTTTGAAVHQLSEIEYFGNQSNDDGDGDGLLKIYEERYPAFLSDANAADAAADQDGDGISNLDEFLKGTNPTLVDSDGDGLNDGAELAAGSNPNSKDSDSDGLSDGDEVNVYHTNPLALDSDNDGFRDKYEVDRGSNPALAASTPGGVTFQVLGTGAASLLGHDFTDREDNGSDATAAGSGFDWVSATASNKPDFQATEGALNVFDNKVGGGEAKWCCDGINATTPEQRVTIRMAYAVAMTHFTVTSSNDSPGRDPRVWKIQGSNDGVTFTDIFSQGDATTSFWGDVRDQVIKFTLPAPAPQYTWFRYSVTATQDNVQHALGEIEYFGIEQDTDGDGLPDSYEVLHPELNLNNPADAAIDIDLDGLTNLQEFQNNTNLSLADTDGDGLSDGVEVSSAVGTNPNKADTDGDGIRDGFEVAKGSNPKDALSLPDFNPIVWGLPTNITGNLSDFQTSGTLLYAWTGGGAAVPVTALGLNFQTGPTLGDRFTGFDPYVRTGNADYDALLNSGSYNGGGPKFLEIKGLTVGQTYRIQIWLADTRAGTANRAFFFSTYDLSDPSVELNAGVNGDEANFPGQFVVGTFTAVDTSQYVYIESSSFGAQYNAIAVYQSSGVAVPSTLKITLARFNNAAFELTVDGFNTAKQYQLRRSVTLNNDFQNVGVPFTPTATTQIVSDPSPPAGKAFYILQELP